MTYARPALPRDTANRLERVWAAANVAWRGRLDGRGSGIDILRFARVVTTSGGTSSNSTASTWGRRYRWSRWASVALGGGCYDGRASRCACRRRRR